MAAQPTDLLRRAFRDVCVGHTRTTILGRTAYIKHLSHYDEIDLDERRAEFYQDARNSGVETEEERMAALRERGEWTDELELALTRAKQEVEALVEGKRKAEVKMPSMVKGYMEKISAAEKAYKEKLLHKRELLYMTCEAWADRELNDYYILRNLYRDASLTVPFLSDEEFNYLKGEDSNEIVRQYNEAMESCSDRNLRRLAMQGFFQRLYALAGESPQDFFGKPICDLTHYQADLLQHGAHFRNIYANHDLSAFPKDVLEDPDLLSEYANSATRAKENLAKSGAYEEGAIVVGMKPEDAKVTGVKAQNPIADIAKNFGGDMMKWAAAQQGAR